MKPSVPKGMRDFSPEKVLKRNYIFNTLRQVFIKYGFQAIETPTMENLSTLTGKYGEEGDQLLFKVLNSGDYLRKAKDLDNYKKLTYQISEKGLRYDLTVPFARYVVMNQNDIAFPFKRYQMQPVWRADKPQKGRYREFYQCDVDVVGSNSLMYEAELLQIFDEGYGDLNIPITIKLNNRKILAGMAEVVGAKEQFMDMTMAIDKLDKIGMDGVRAEMEKRGIQSTSIDKIETILACKTLEDLAPLMEGNEMGMKGIEELQTVFDLLKPMPLKNDLEFDVTLARGLNYYTGAIVEVKAKGVQMGSVGAGGRYDDLTGMFGLKNVSGVGVSFGFDRIYDVMEELNLFPEQQGQSTQAIFLSFDEQSFNYAFQAAGTLRKAGINTEVYPEPVKFKKQMKYANTRKIPYVIVVGEEEVKSGLLSLKNMEKGEQQKLSITDIIQYLS